MSRHVRRRKFALGEFSSERRCSPEDAATPPPSLRRPGPWVLAPAAMRALPGPLLRRSADFVRATSSPATPRRMPPIESSTTVDTSSGSAEQAVPMFLFAFCINPEISREAAARPLPPAAAPATGTAPPARAAAPTPLRPAPRRPPPSLKASAHRRFPTNPSAPAVAAGACACC